MPPGSTAAGTSIASAAGLGSGARSGPCGGARATGSRGIFLLYEPTRRDGEDLPAWLDRFLRTNKPRRSVLTADEWEQIWHHVTTCDFPETGPVWCELGREAGFGAARQVFVDPTDFFRLYRFE